MNDAAGDDGTAGDNQMDEGRDDEITARARGAGGDTRTARATGTRGRRVEDDNNGGPIHEAGTTAAHPVDTPIPHHEPSTTPRAFTSSATSASTKHVDDDYIP